MNDEQFYVLDSIGVVVQRHALAADFVTELNARISEVLIQREVDKFPIIELGSQFMDLMVHPWIVASCTRALGDGFRFDHAFGLQQPLAKPNLHGGPQACQSSCFYHSGQSRKGAAWMGRLSVGVALSCQSRETGGFAYIPGSHKSSCIMHGSQVFSNLLGSNFEHECLCTPTLEPGDIYLFPDCLVHGTTPWRESATRRTLYYMYSPGYMAWRPYAEIEKYVPLAKTPLQRQLLRSPYVARFAESPVAVGDNHWREPNQ